MAMLFALVFLALSVQAQVSDCDVVGLQTAYQTALTAYNAAETAHNDAIDANPPLTKLAMDQLFKDLKKAGDTKDDAKKALEDCLCAQGNVNYCCDAGGGGDVDGRRLQSICGDPITSFQGVETRYWLSMEHFTPMLTQGFFVVSQLAGPANPPPGFEAHKGAWVVATEVDMAGLDKIRIETVDPTTLLAPHPNATVPPATADALTTMRLSVGGKQLAAGEHTLSMADATIAVSAKRDPSMRRIGIGWVEQITIKADGLELRIMSSKANKFADEQQQVLGLHLDVAFLTFDESAVRGALPEMWGLQPMSEDTKLLLDEKNVEN